MQGKAGKFGFWGSDFGNAWCIGKSRGVDPCTSCIPGNSPCFQPPPPPDPEGRFSCGLLLGNGEEHSRCYLERRVEGLKKKNVHCMELPSSLRMTCGFLKGSASHSLQVTGKFEGLRCILLGASVFSVECID